MIVAGFIMFMLFGIGLIIKFDKSDSCCTDKSNDQDVKDNFKDALK